MWTADRWIDFEVLDTSSGERLERWGKYTLVRPDPQVIWMTEKKDPRWRSFNARYHRSKKGGGDWEFRDLPKTWQITYHDLTFNLQPFAFKHTGVFPEQAANWDWFSKLIKERVRRDSKSRGLGSASSEGAPATADPGEAASSVRVLNLFAYTGGATLAALKAGASVAHVDASKGMVTWARENAVSSGLADRPVRWLVDDCMKFVNREIRRGHKYDAIIMDPPSYGRGPKGEIWKIEEEIHGFVRACAELLSDDPLFFLINSYTTGLQPGVLTYLLSDALKGRFPNVQIEAGEVALPVSDSGLVLPCGCSGRATF